MATCPFGLRTLYVKNKQNCTPPIFLGAKIEEIMTDPDNKSFSFQSEADFTEAINKIIGSHVTKRFETFESRLEGKLDQAFAKLTPLKEDKVSDETPEKLTLKKLEERLSRTEKERDTERAANREKTLRAAVSEQISKSGLAPAAQKLVISHLITEKKAFLNDDGEPVFVGEYTGETLPLHEGVGNWLKTEGKELLPVKQGTQIRPIRTNNPNQDNTQQTEQEQDAVIMQLMQKRRDLGL